MSTFNIVAVGPPGSGKTMYLATLHHYIASGNLARGVSLVADMREEQRLEDLYNEIANPEHDFPEYTNPGAEMREVVFRLKVDRTKPLLFGGTKSLNFDVFDLTYIDYAGEWVSNPNRQKDQANIIKFQKRLEEAHAILCFIDGLMLLKSLEGDSAIPASFETDLYRTIRLVSNQSKPTNLVITKWDALVGKYNLRDVASYLMETPGTGLPALVASRSSQRLVSRKPIGGIRLIPVSSVGTSFVELTPEYRVEKTGNGQPKPINVEIPLIAAVADICDLSAELLRRATEDTTGDLDGVREVVTSGSAVMHTGNNSAGLAVGLLGLYIDPVKLIAFSGGVTVRMARILGRPMLKSVRLLAREYRRIRARGLDGVTTEEGALMYVANEFRGRLKIYERSSRSIGSKLWFDEVKGWQVN